MIASAQWTNPGEGIFRKRGSRGGNVPNFTESARDQRLADPLIGHLPLHRTRWGIVYHCTKCGADCTGPAMWCDEHLASVVLRP